MLPRVLTFAPNVPYGTALRHLNDAARTFARRTLCWNYEHSPISAVLGQSAYELSLGASEVLVKVLACDVNNGQTYQVRNGALGRRLVREASGTRVCVASLPGTITLTPAPPVADVDIIVDIAVMPDETCSVDWPDELEEHAEYIAAGALGTLCAMPKATAAWSDLSVAADQRDKFMRRIDAVYHKTAATLSHADPRSSARWF